MEERGAAAKSRVLSEIAAASQPGLQFKTSRPKDGALGNAHRDGKRVHTAIDLIAQSLFLVAERHRAQKWRRRFKDLARICIIEARVRDVAVPAAQVVAQDTLQYSNPCVSPFPKDIFQK